jgi:hypothetical protein
MRRRYRQRSRSTLQPRQGVCVTRSSSLRTAGPATAAGSDTGRRLLRQAGPAIAVGALLGIERACAPLGDSDVLWGSRTGMDILSSGSLPHHATYSWSAAGRSWTPNSWGWDVILGTTYRLGGMTAIGFLEIVIVVALACVVAVAAARVGAHPGWTAVVFAVIGRFILADLRARPQVVAYLMIFVLPALLPRVLSGQRGRALKAAAIICALQIVWVNLHSSGVIAPAMLGIGGVGLLLRDHRVPPNVWRPQLARLVVLICASAACCLATPYGTALITNVFEVRRASVGLISEWEHVGVQDSNQVLGLVAIALAVIAGYFAARSRRYDTVGYLLLFAIATATAVRFTPILFLLAIPELAVLAGRLKVREAFLMRVVAAGCVVLAAFTVAGLGSFGKLDAAVGSPRLVSAIPHGCRLVNDYTVGGAVMLARPDLRVSVDGRNDMYGRSLLLSVEGMLSNEPGTIARIDARGVDCVLTQSDDKLVAALTALPNWRVAGSDEHRTLLLRVSP